MNTLSREIGRILLLSDVYEKIAGHRRAAKAEHAGEFHRKVRDEIAMRKDLQGIGRKGGLT